MYYKVSDDNVLEPRNNLIPVISYQLYINGAIIFLEGNTYVDVPALD